MILRLTLLLSMIVGCSCASLPEQPKAATLRLQFPDNRVCSATAIARAAILSAAHCFSAESGKISVNGVAGGYRVIANDGKDHVLVRITQPQEHVARMSLDHAKQGQRIYVYGAPASMTDVLRFGRVAHVAKDGELLIDATIWRGDSGAAIFSEHGRIIGVVSAVKGQELFYMAVAFPLRFTKAQWAEARA